MFKPIYLGLGSNRDNRLWYIVKAIRMLDKSPNIEIGKISSIYETEPYGLKGQRDFLNSVVEIETNFRPAKLLQFIKFIEKKMGRIDRRRWHPREIDIDILAYQSLQLNLSWLTIPHKELHQRNFVLTPFCEIAHGFIVVGHKKPVQDLNENCQDQGKVQLVYPSKDIHINLDAPENVIL